MELFVGAEARFSQPRLKVASVAVYQLGDLPEWRRLMLANANILATPDIRYGRHHV